MKLEPASDPAAVSGSDVIPSDSNAGGPLTTTHRPRAASLEPGSGSSWAIERWLLGQVLAACGNPAVGIALWDGAEVGPSTGSSLGKVVIRDRTTLWRLLLDPRVAFGDAYSDGMIEV